MTLMLLSVTLIFGGIFTYKWLQGVMMGEYFASFRPPPVTVSAASAQQQSWHPYLTAIGTLRARYGVNISAEVEGMVKAIRFDSGQDVNKGQLLLELDDEVEQANLRIFGVAKGVERRAGHEEIIDEEEALKVIADPDYIPNENKYIYDHILLVMYQSFLKILNYMCYLHHFHTNNLDPNLAYLT